GRVVSRRTASGARVAPDGRFIVTHGGEPGAFRIFRTSTCEEWTIRTDARRARPLADERLLLEWSNVDWDERAERVQLVTTHGEPLSDVHTPRGILLARPSLVAPQGKAMWLVGNGAVLFNPLTGATIEASRRISNPTDHTSLAATAFAVDGATTIVAMQTRTQFGTPASATIEVLRADTGETLHQHGVQVEVRNVALIRDGTLGVVQSYHRIEAFRVADGHVVLSIALPAQSVDSMAELPDGRLLLALSDTALAILDPDSGELLGPDHLLSTSAPAVSDNGRFVLAVRRNQVTVIDRDAGCVVDKLAPAGVRIEQALISDGGDTMLIAHGSIHREAGPGIVVHDRKTGTTRLDIEIGYPGAFAMAGHAIAFADDSDVVCVDRSTLRELDRVPIGGACLSVALSADGRFAAATATASRRTVVRFLHTFEVGNRRSRRKRRLSLSGRQMQLARNGRTLVLESSYHDLLRLHGVDAYRGSEVHDVQTDTFRVYGIVLQADDSRVWAQPEEEHRLVAFDADPATGWVRNPAVEWAWPADAGSALDFPGIVISRDGRTLVAALNAVGMLLVYQLDD
ncbi:MAG: WD40 repeat domain-containing protein, partial [Planctomycetota bacterium]